MSRDGYLVIDTGGSEPVEVADIGNYTHNVASMWHGAVEASTGHKSLNVTDGMTGAEAAPILAAAAEHMALHPELYEPLNPANGWGDYAGATAYLQRAAEACAAHPKATLRWSV